MFRRRTVARLVLAAVLGLGSLAAAAAPVWATTPRPGQLDRSFGDRGSLVIDAPVAGLVATTMAVQPDGAIVIGGFAREDVSQGRRAAAVVLRLTPDGALDPTFGTGGVALVEPGPQVTAIAVQADGRVVLAGGRSYEAVFIRLNRDGGLDPSFSGDGTVSVTIGNSPGVTDLAVQRDGRIVAATYQGYSGRTWGLALRLLADGTPDPSFGIPRPDGGWDGIFFGFPTGDGGFLSPSVYSAVDLAPKGDILLAGVNTGERRPAQFVGRLPTATATRPIFTTRSPANYDSATEDPDVAALSDGRVVLSGTALPPQIGFPRPSRGLLLSIFSPDLDLREVQRTRVFAGRGDAYARALATDSRDGVVMLGAVGARFEPRRPKLGLVRYSGPRLELDRSFGQSGRVLVPIGLNEAVRELAVLPDGKILTMTTGDEYRPPTPIRLTKVHGTYDLQKPRVRLRGLPRCVTAPFRLRVAVRDLSPIAAIRVTLNGRSQPRSARRTYRIRPRQGRLSAHRLVVRVRDAANNTTTISRRLRNCRP